MKIKMAVLALPVLSMVGCVTVPKDSQGMTMAQFSKINSAAFTKKEALKSLATVEMNNPGVSIRLPSGKIHRSGHSSGVFLAPKAIDCSGLSVQPDHFKRAIEAGAMIVDFKTPSVIVQKKEIEDKKTGKVEVKKEKVSIKSSYGGVLALCKISPNAKGPDSRSYRIRDLNNYLVKGKNGFVSVVASQLNTRESSWMLWLTDRKPIFTEYAADVAERQKAIETLSKVQ